MGKKNVGLGCDGLGEAHVKQQSTELRERDSGIMHAAAPCWPPLSSTPAIVSLAPAAAPQDNELAPASVQGRLPIHGVTVGRLPIHRVSPSTERLGLRLWHGNVPLEALEAVAWPEAAEHGMIDVRARWLPGLSEEEENDRQMARLHRGTQRCHAWQTRLQGDTPDGRARAARAWNGHKPRGAVAQLSATQSGT